MTKLKYPLKVIGKEIQSFPRTEIDPSLHFSIIPANEEKINVKKITFINKGKKNMTSYSVLPIEIYVAKFGKPQIKTSKDDDLSNYLNNGFAEKEHRDGKAKTTIVFSKNKILGYFTLRLTTIKTTIQINNESKAYKGCENLRSGSPVIELLMYARDDSNKKLPMRIIFKKEILPQVKSVIKRVGTNDLYLECDEKIAAVYEKLGFRAFGDFYVDDVRMLAMLRPIEI